jgi:hypothetical protein
MQPGTYISMSISYILKIYEYLIREVALMREKDRDKFVKLANRRVSNALKAIQLIGNLSNRSNYDYTDMDVQKIFKALQDELGAAKKRFELAQKRSPGTASFVLE